MPFTQDELNRMHDVANAALAHYKSLAPGSPDRAHYYAIAKRLVEEYNQALKQNKKPEALQGENITLDSATSNAVTAPPKSNVPQEPSPPQQDSDKAPSSTSPHTCAANPPPPSNVPPEPSTNVSPPLKSDPNPPHSDSAPQQSPSLVKSSIPDDTKDAEGVADPEAFSRLLEKFAERLEVKFKSMHDAWMESNHNEMLEEILEQVGGVVKNTDGIPPLIRVTSEIHEDGEVMKRVLVGGRKKGEPEDGSQKEEQEALMAQPIQLRLQRLEESFQRFETLLSNSIKNAPSFSDVQLLQIQSIVENVTSTALRNSQAPTLAALMNIESKVRQTATQQASFPSPQSFVGESLSQVAHGIKSFIDAKPPPPASEHEKDTQVARSILAYNLHLIAETAAQAVRTRDPAGFQQNNAGNPILMTKSNPPRSPAPPNTPTLPKSSPLPISPHPPTLSLPSISPGHSDLEAGARAAETTAASLPIPPGPPGIPSPLPEPGIVPPSTSQPAVSGGDPQTTGPGQLALPSPPELNQELPIPAQEMEAGPAGNTRMSKRKASIVGRSTDPTNAKKAKAPNSKRGKAAL